MRVTRYRIADAEGKSGWGGPDFHGSDLIDAGSHPGAEMTVGFTRVAARQQMTATFPYDEVMVILKGSVVVNREHDDPVTGREGDVLYLPANSTNTYEFDTEFEAAYIASPPRVYARHVIDTGHG
ncbi:MAG TPA: cupin domain-containing protein [Beutenbergiaceae bacterium]|nr:cupin domain-containing protein [Beutenbergiaceae bacterium]